MSNPCIRRLLSIGHSRGTIYTWTTTITALAFSSSRAFELPPTRYLPPKPSDGSEIAYIHHCPCVASSEAESDVSSNISNINNQSSDDLGLIFYPGFLSNMHSSKACKVYQHAVEHNLECTLFDRYGHGSSRPHYISDQYNGREATMGRWLDDSLDVMDTVTKKDNKQILIGSSMGTWLAILTAMQRPERVAAIIGIASAPDYTALLRKQIETNHTWAKYLEEKGYVDVPTIYDRRGYYRIHRELIDEGDHHLLLEGDLKMSALKDIPMRLIHGLDDNDIPYEYSQRLVDRWGSSNGKHVRLDLIEGGDHRLSSPDHLQKIQKVLSEVVKDVAGM